MKAPISWLKEYAEINITPEELADAMTMSGTKVEGIEVQGDKIKNVVVCRMEKVEKHSDADKLLVVQANIGEDELLQVVTGAPNVKEGSYVPVALVGASLPGGIKIKKGKLRGVESFGMFCSAAELGRSAEDFSGAVEDGLLVLEDIGFSKEELEKNIGKDIRDLLGMTDVVIDFEVTSNRPDCFSIIGLAREAAATLGTGFNVSPVEIKNADYQDSPEKYISVKVEDPELCPRYCARVVKNVKIGPSPKWLADRLMASGVRAINNIVDITNYVMLEYGQPMHAFDLKNLSGNQIVVRRAKDGEKIITLDGEERKLSSERLVIADAQKPIAVAGVMGGEYSGVNDDTETVIFESANFDPFVVRIGAKELGMRTESSSRFEKGLDLNNVIPAIDRACQLVEMLGAGTVVDGRIDVCAKENEPLTLDFNPDAINAFLGTDVTRDEMVKILNSLEFKVDGGKITVPTFRPDITMEADIAEEIARFYGYNKIESSLLEGKATTQGMRTAKQKAEEKIIDILTACGLYETLTYSFTSPRVFDMLRLPEDDERRNAITISNPLGEDYSIMRTTTVPEMLDIISRNYNRRIEGGGFFEAAYVYVSNEKPMVNLPEHREIITIGMYGKNYDFYSLKGIIEELVDKMNVKADFEPETEDCIFHPGRCANILVGGKKIGVFGEVHPEVSENFECPERTYIAVIEKLPLIENSNYSVKFKELPKYPAITRDIAMLVKDDVMVRDIEKVLIQKGRSILESFKLFDVYKGSQLPEGMKSVAYSLVFRGEDRTLTDSEVQKVMDKIIEGLSSTLGAQLR